VQSLYTMPVTLLANALKQNTLVMDLSSISLIMLGGGWLGKLSCSSGCMRPGMVVSCTPAGVSSGVWGVRVDLGVMLRILLRGRFRWPFALAGLAMRYLRTMCASRWGAPLRKPALMALSNEAMGGLQKLWWANFTLLILVVRAYEKKPADSTTGMRWEQFKPGPNCCWVCLLVLLFCAHPDRDSWVVFATLS
jgi:hypothetical protein